MSLALKYMRVSLSETLAAHAGDVGVNFPTAAGLINDLEAGDPGSEARARERLQVARTNQQVFYGRAGDLIQRYLGINRVNEEVDTAAANRYLLQREGPRAYVGTEGVAFGNAFAGPIGLWVDSLANAVKRYRQLEGGAGGKSSAAQVKRQRGGRVLSKRYKVKTGRKRASKRRGKTRKIKIKLSKGTVNKLVREAAKSKRSKRVVPLRLLVSYRGKLKGRRIPVARMVDVQLRVKAKAKRKKR